MTLLGCLGHWRESQRLLSAMETLLQSLDWHTTDIQTDFPQNVLESWPLSFLISKFNVVSDLQKSTTGSKLINMHTEGEQIRFEAVGIKKNHGKNITLGATESIICQVGKKIIR